MKQPRSLTASGKAKSASANGQGRSGWEVVDKRGFVSIHGSMATSPQNDAGVSDLRPRWEEKIDGVWVDASWAVKRKLDTLTGIPLKAYLAARSGLVRRRPVNAHGLGEDQTAWECPRDYDLDLDKSDALRKALKVGLLTLSGRSYKLRMLRADTYEVRGAKQTINFTRDAILDVLATGRL